MISRKTALHMISQAPKGEERALLLADDSFRALVLNSGANVTIYEGEVQEGETCREMLSEVYVGLIQRKNKRGLPDGLGALGGMAERTSPEQFAALTAEQKKALVGQKDDVVLVQGAPVLINDMERIRKNNVMREMREELADLGVFDEHINPHQMELVPMPKVKDDNYMINIWNGTGECYAVTPYCHLYKDTEGLLDRLTAKAQERAGGEAKGLVKMPLFEALGAYGNVGTQTCALEDGRHAEKDYRYPHEHLAAWALAAKLLNHEPDKMIMLVKEVQVASHHPLSFLRLARVTSQTLGDVAKTIGVSMQTMREMEKTTVHQFFAHDYIRSLKNHPHY